MGALEEAVVAFATQGTPYLLAALSWFVTLFLYRRTEELRKALDTQRDSAQQTIKDMYEKRLSEFGVSAATIERNSHIFSEVRASVGDQSEAINELVKSVAEMARDIQANRSRWQDKGEQIMRSLETLQQRIETLQGNLSRRG